MPRYFFHVINRSAIIDTEGVELAGIAEARAMALQTAGEILSSEGDQFWHDGKWRMSVADAAGNICFTLDFSADTHERKARE